MEECFIFKAISVDTCGWIKGHPTTQHDPSILHPFFIHPASFLLIHFSSFIFLSSQPSFSSILHLIFHPSFLLRCHNSFLPYFYSSFITYLIHFSFSFLISHSVSFILSFFFQENLFYFVSDIYPSSLLFSSYAAQYPYIFVFTFSCNTWFKLNYSKQTNPNHFIVLVSPGYCYTLTNHHEYIIVWYLHVLGLLE